MCCRLLLSCSSLLPYTVNETCRCRDTSENRVSEKKEKQQLQRDITLAREHADESKYAINLIAYTIYSE